MDRAASMVDTTEWQKPIRGALANPSGARFYRCALQVNPFQYLERHGTPSNFADEDLYNEAVIHACVDQGIEVIAVTDHYRVSDSTKLIECARSAGIVVFQGFEATTKDGVHFLCLFNPSVDTAYIDRVIGDCGVHDGAEPSPTGKYDAVELLEEARNWDAACIAAHVCSAGGLLTVLSGQARIKAWTSPHLLACSLPGPAQWPRKWVDTYTPAYTLWRYTGHHGNR